MTNPDIFKESPQLPPAEQALVDAYLEVGQPLDRLIYTPRFDELLQKAGVTDMSEAAKRDALDKLLRLRKSARLPALGLPTLL